MENHIDAAQLWLLQNLKPDIRSCFLQLGQTISYPKGHLILRVRERRPDILFILGGKIQIYTLTKCGKKKILFILGKDNIANDSFLYDSNAVYCETLETCQFFQIRREALLSLMEKDFQLTKALFAYQEWKLARDFGRPTEKGVRIDMDLSVTFLADLLGAPRETTSRVCKKLADQGLIYMEKKKIYIPDMERMAQFHGK